MAVNLSFIGGAGWQFLDNNGNPLGGGKIYTYAAGTVTPQATFTGRDGITANTNPIILDAAGRTPAQIWSTEGVLYKYTVTTATDVSIRVWDNIGGSVVASDLAQDLAAPAGSSLVGFLQAGTGAVATTVQTKLRDSVSVLDFGAVPNIAGDQTSAFQLALTALTTGGILEIPAGKYHVNLVITRLVTLQGNGSSSTLLESFTSAGAVITNQCTFSGSWESQIIINDLQIKGTDTTYTATGIQLGSTVYASSQEFAGRVQCNRVYFNYLNYCVHKLWGNIGNSFNRCVFSYANFAMHATAKTGAMHAGNDYFQDECEFDTILKAVFYYNSENSGTGAVTVDDSCLVQFCPGFVWFVPFFNALDFAPGIISSGWNEANATGTNITIDSVLYPTPVWGHFVNAGLISIKNQIITTLTLVNSTVVADQCQYALGYKITKDNDSAFVSNDAQVYQGLLPETVNGIVSMFGPLGGQKGGISIPHPHNATYEHSAKILYSETFSNSLIPFVGTASLTTTDQADGPIFPKSQELTISAGQTEYPSASVVIPNVNSYLVTTLTVRLVSGLPVQITSSKTQTLGIYAVVNHTVWKTYVFLGKVTSAADVALSVSPPSSGTTVLRFGGCQMLQFDALQDALDFANAGLFAVDRVVYPKMFYGAAPPVTGIWGVGDRCINNLPAIGNPKSWVYSATSVWTSEGNL